MKTPLSLLAVSGLLLLSSLAHAGKPLKVFILAGQSNMTGRASFPTFEAIGMDPKTAPMLKDMKTADGKPVVCDDVYIALAPMSADIPEKFGKLTIGYSSTKGGPRIGPEYTFGIYMQKMLGEPILLIKTAWGGRSLYEGFRPPSAGGELPTGEYYTMMMDYVKKVLDDPKRVCPIYNPEDGYELSGFAWVQGHADRNGKNYPPADPTQVEKKGVKLTREFPEYTRLLACLIRDVRKELSAPKLPFVVGVFGMEGKEADQNTLNFRKAMAATAEMDEFKGTGANVFLEHFWPEEISGAKRKMSDILSGKQKAEGEVAETLKAYQSLAATARKSIEGKKLYERLEQLVLTPDELKLLKVGVSNTDYHYYGSAKFYGQTGKALAEALVELNKAAQ